MTWLTRLPLQNRRLHWLAIANHKYRTRQGRRRRQMVNLESLENRALLAGNVTVLAVVNGILTINADTHSDHFTITENGGNEVTVSGQGSTRINNLLLGVSVPSSQVTSIVVNVPGTSQNSPVILLNETAGVTSGIKGVSFNVNGVGPTNGPDVNLTVSQVNNTGPLTVTDIPGGQLDVLVADSQFTSLAIEQFGCCAANVDLERDRVNGPVTVGEGWARNDAITFHDDNFGSTTFTLGNGPNPNMPNCDNAGSTISGDDSNLTDLIIDEPLAGDNQSISVGTAKSDVEVSVNSFGIRAMQGDGNSKTIQLVSITTSGSPVNNLRNGPDSIVTFQGDGNKDSTVIDDAQVFGNISSNQGNGALDFVGYYGNNAGYSLTEGPLIQDFFGTATIIQGDGKNDVATLDCGKIQDPGAEQFFNNVLINQGNGSITTPDCDQQTGDTINVNWTHVTSDMTLEQGEGDATAGLDLGANSINIATTSAVFVGDSTVINEIGANNGDNTIIMGGIGGPDSGDIDFETGFLDVFTGAAGGTYVQVENTQVDFGFLGLFGPFNINGEGSGNTPFLDVFSSLTVTSNIERAAPVLTWAGPADITYGTALGATQLNASTTVPGRFVYTPAAGTVLSAGAGQTLSVTFTPIDTADYTPVTTTTTINVQMATPVLTWAGPAAITYGRALGTTQLDASTTVPGRFVYTPAAGTVLPAGAGRKLSVTFTPTDTADYKPVTATTTINVQKATPVLTWADPADITYGTALGATQLDASTTVPGRFVYTPAAGTVLSAGTGQKLSVTFTPTDTADYKPVTATAMINVNPAPLSIAADSVSKVYGQQNPRFSATYAGLTNGDLPSSLGGSLQFSTASTASSPINTYSVVPYGLASPNYAITFAAAKLVVTPASLTITANNQSRVYGQPNPPLTAYYLGFVNGDTPASLTAPVALSTSAVLDSFGGSYPVFVGGAALPNYTIRFVSGTLTIMPPTNPVNLGRIAFVTSLYSDLLLTPPGPADLFSLLHLSNAGRWARRVASAIIGLPARLTVMRSHNGVGMKLHVALRQALKVQRHAIQIAQCARSYVQQKTLDRFFPESSE